MIVSNHISILDFLGEVNYKLFFHLRTSHLLNSSVSEFQAWTMLSWKVKWGAQWQGWGYGLSCGSLQGFPVAIHRLSVNAKFIKPKRRQAQHLDFTWLSVISVPVVWWLFYNYAMFPYAQNIQKMMGKIPATYTERNLGNERKCILITIHTCEWNDSSDLSWLWKILEFLFNNTKDIFVHFFVI